MKEKNQAKILIEKEENSFKIEIIGLPYEVMAEISMLVSNLKENNLLSEKQIRRSVEIGLKSNDELKKDTENLMNELLEELLKDKMED